MGKLNWLLSKQQPTKIARGATEVEAAYLAFVRAFWADQGYYSAEVIAEWIPTGYSLTRIGDTSAGALWRVTDGYYDYDECSQWAPSCFILDGADGAEVVVTKSKDGNEVRVVDEWESVVAANPEAFAEDTEATILKHLNGELEQSTVEKQVRIVRSDEAQRYTLGVAYPADELDSHGDFSTPDDLEVAAWNYMVKSRNAGLDHADGTDGEGVIVESYIYRGPDWIDGTSGKTIAKSGDWMLGAVWPEDAWASIVKGERTGWSIQGLAAIDDDVATPSEV
jgi:hypothetical protein